MTTRAALLLSALWTPRRLAALLRGPQFGRPIEDTGGARTVGPVPGGEHSARDRAEAAKEGAER